GKHERERKLRTAPGWGLLAEGPEAFLEGPCPPTLKSSRCTMRRPVRCSGDSSAGRRSPRYFEPVSRSSPPLGDAMLAGPHAVHGPVRSAGFFAGLMGHFGISVA